MQDGVAASLFAQELRDLLWWFYLAGQLNSTTAFSLPLLRKRGAEESILGRKKKVHGLR